MGHENFGCGAWDRKGLTSSNVTVNGVCPRGSTQCTLLLRGAAAGLARVQHGAGIVGGRGVADCPVQCRPGGVGRPTILPVRSVVHCTTVHHLAVARLISRPTPSNGLAPTATTCQTPTCRRLGGPRAWHGSTASIWGGTGRRCMIGIIDGWRVYTHCLPQAGPQLTLYVPGPVLKEGTNELVLLEVGSTPSQLQGVVGCVHDIRTTQHSATGWCARVRARHKWSSCVYWREEPARTYRRAIIVTV